jgi:hypothetical protein
MMTRRSERLKAMAPKGHPTGPVGHKGSYQRSQLGAVMRGGRVLTYHATKGWRNRRA